MKLIVKREVKHYLYAFLMPETLSLVIIERTLTHIVHDVYFKRTGLQCFYFLLTCSHKLAYQ